MEHTPFIPFHVPMIGDEEVHAVTSVLRSGWLTTGAVTAQFQKEFARYVQAHYALAVNSCTAGLHLAMKALGVGPGDEVITTPMTFCSTVNTILHVGAAPVLADIGPDGNFDPDRVESLLSKRTKLLLPVHLAGLPCEMGRIWEIARRKSLFVLEDAAHAVGAKHNGAMVGAAGAGGSRSDAVAYSFYATKNLTTGEGGMITTHEKELAERMRLLCLHGISNDAWGRYTENGRWYYEVIDCGFKYNLSDIQSAIGIQQLRKQETFLDARTAIANRYSQAFRGLDELQPPPDRADSRHAWHLYILRLNLNRLTIGRNRFIDELKTRGIGTSVHFIPILLHPYYRDRLSQTIEQCPRALDLYRRSVSLPLYPALSESDIDRVIAAVIEVARRFRRVAV